MSSRSRWASASGTIFLAIAWTIYALCASSHTPGSDGHYSWIYARSLAFDFDLDFRNDYALCGDPFEIGAITPAGRPGNIFYIGPALVWTPAIWLLKHFVHAADPAIAGACTGPIPTYVLAFSGLAGALTTAVSVLILGRFLSHRRAAVSALLASIGGPLLYFSGLNPSYSQAYDALFVALFLYALVRLREDGSRDRFALLAGVLLGFAVLQRASNVIFLLAAFGAVLVSSRPTPNALKAKRLFFIAALAFAVGVVPLAAANRSIFGAYTLYTHGPNFMHVGHGHPWLLLFDPKGGLLMHAPILWLAVFGAIPMLRDRACRWFALPVFALLVIEVYVSSCALDWQAGRRLCNMTPLFALAIARALSPMIRWLRARPTRPLWVVASSMIVSCAWTNGSISHAFSHEKLPWEHPLTNADLNGEAQKQALASIERTTGVINVMPAALVFAARYDLPPDTFGEAAFPRWYSRDFQTLTYTADAVTFGRGGADRLLVGFDRTRCLRGSRGRLVFAAQWPYATRARVSSSEAMPNSLKVRARGFWGTGPAWIRRDLRHRVSEWEIPPGGFDSGINELEFDVDHETFCILRIDFLDEGSVRR